MNRSSSDTLDRSIVAALLQSDAVIDAIQGELHALYPGRAIAATTIRRALRKAVARQELLSDEQSALAQTQLDGAATLRADKRQQTKVHAFPAAHVSEGEESVQEVLLYDKTYATYGG